LIVNDYSFDLHTWIEKEYPGLNKKLYDIAKKRVVWKDVILEQIQKQEEAKEKEQAVQQEAALLKEKKVAENIKTLNETEFIWESDQLKGLKNEELKLQLKKHGLIVSGTKKVLIERLEEHFHPWMPETCTCIYLPFSPRVPSEYVGEYAVVFWDTETDVTGYFMEIFMVDIVTGKSYESLVSVPTKMQKPRANRSYLPHKITYEMTNNAPTFPEVWSQILDFFSLLNVKQEILLISHGNFDQNALKKNLESYNETLFIPPFLRFGDSLKLTRLVRGDLAKHDLDSLLNAYQIKPQGDRHRAKPDAEALKSLVLKMVSQRATDLVSYLFAFFCNMWNLHSK
jgi:hypothetical protein